jgi:hypothetical protein
MELGGLGLDMPSVAVIFEEAGYSLLGPQALNCAAPDEGNMHMLDVIASPAQRERWRSCDLDEIIGAPFYVTTFVDGHVLSGAHVPPTLDGPDASSWIAERLIDVARLVRASSQMPPTTLFAPPKRG